MKRKALFAVALLFGIAIDRVFFFSVSRADAETKQTKSKTETLEYIPGALQWSDPRAKTILAQCLGVVQKALADNAMPNPAASMNRPSLYHEGKRADDPNESCGGAVKEGIRDDGKATYKCEVCGKAWDAK